MSNLCKLIAAEREHRMNDPVVKVCVFHYFIAMNILVQRILYDAKAEYIIQWMLDIVNLTLTEGLLYYVGQFTILIDTNKWLFIYFS